MATATEPHRAAGACPVLEQRTRTLADTDARLVRADEASEPRFVGHAAVFNSRTAIGNPLRWGWYEQIAPGTFTKTLQDGDARFLIDHRSNLLVARVSAGDLRLAEDATGLAVDADLDTELSYVRDLVRNLEKRRITGMSFGFWVVRDEWTTETVELSDGTSAEVDLRTIQEVRLAEVSGVTFPAYEDTDAGLRSLCSEIRAARGLTTPDHAPDAPGARSAPAEATRSSDEPAPAEATRDRLRATQRRAVALAARYLLTK